MSSLQSALSKDSKHSLCYGETALIPCISIINQQISKQQTGGGGWRGQMAGLPHMLMLYERVRERETENRQINTQTEGGRGRKTQVKEWQARPWTQQMCRIKCHTGRDHMGQFKHTGGLLQSFFSDAHSVHLLFNWQQVTFTTTTPQRETRSKLLKSNCSTLKDFKKIIKKIQKWITCEVQSVSHFSDKSITQAPRKWK